MNADRPSLAATLMRLKKAERLSYAFIGRIAGLTRNTVRLIAVGTTRQPSADTLCRIAVALATDPYDRRIDQEKLARFLRELGAAAGYADLKLSLVDETLPVLLAVLVGDHEQAAAWVRLIADAPAADVTDVRAMIRRDVPLRPTP